MSSTPYFLLSDSMGGCIDARFPLPNYRWDIPWTPDCSEASVMRFLSEAKYYLSVYNTVIQHLLSFLPFEKYFAEGSDLGRNKKKRDTFYAILWNAQELENILNPEFDDEGWHSLASLVEGPEELDGEVDKSVESFRELMDSTSAQDSGNVSEVGSVEELLQPPTSTGPLLFSRLKKRFQTLLDAEVDKLRKKLELTFPQYADKNINKISKLLMKTFNYGEYLTYIENNIGDVEWPSWDGRINHNRIDLREPPFARNPYHVVFAPHFVINFLTNVCSYNYLLVKKTNEFEKIMERKVPIEYAKLKELKEKIPLPLKYDHAKYIYFSK